MHVHSNVQNLKKGSKKKKAQTERFQLFKSPLAFRPKRDLR